MSPKTRVNVVILFTSKLGPFIKAAKFEKLISPLLCIRFSKIKFPPIALVTGHMID